MTNRAALDRRGILWYIAISFGLTWALDFALLAAGASFDASMPIWAFAGIAVSMFFPALSAFIVRKWITREGFASAGLKFGPWRYYLVLWLGIPLLFGVVYGLSWLLGFAQLDLGMTAAMDQLAAMAAQAGQSAAPPPPAAYAVGVLIGSMTVGALVTTVATFGEEFGWTGYLLPKLLPLGKWPAALIYGLIWGLWHAPVILGGYNYPDYPVLGVALMCVFTITIGFWQTALRLRSGSVLLTSWFHGIFNSQGRGIWLLLFVGVDPLLGGALGLVGLLLFGALGAWLLAATPSPAPAAPPTGIVRPSGEQALLR